VANGEFTVKKKIFFKFFLVQISTFGGHWRHYRQDTHQWKQYFGGGLPQ
jgi:hypothetical protein